MRGPSLPQKGHGFHAVAGHVQVDRIVGVAKSFLGQPKVAWTVFDQESIEAFPFLR